MRSIDPPPTRSDRSGVAARARRDGRQHGVRRRQARRRPDGSRVAIELTGPLQRTIRVAVEGRAPVVDDFGAEPTTTITLDGLLFTRLAVDDDALGIRAPSSTTVTRRSAGGSSSTSTT